MINFDKLKLVSSADNINILQGFVITTQNNQVVRQKFKITSPCLVEMVINTISNELTIEFTAKLLKSNYPLLINANTIRTCLEAINRIGVCVLNIDTIMNDATVVKCDVTKDVAGIDLADLKGYISTHIVNHNRWTMRPILNNDNVIIEKNVVTPRNKRRLTVYDKEEEMMKATNKDFLAWAGEELKDSFKGITRFELSLTTCAAIRSVLMIEDTSLETVLNADANPIADLLDSALRKDTCFTSTITTLSQFDKQTTLAYYNWDIEAIEKNARIIYKDRYHRNKLEPYQRLIDAHAHSALFPPDSYDFQALCTFDTDDEEYSTTITVSKDYWESSGLTVSDTSNSDNFDFITPKSV
ncbi:MAG: hypothetical protein K6A95_08155 [Bacteroidales bacterium]|nr:hypothetical protein [Bacteroidales bacterium]